MIFTLFIMDHRTCVNDVDRARIESNIYYKNINWTKNSPIGVFLVFNTLKT